MLGFLNASPLFFEEHASSCTIHAIAARPAQERRTSKAGWRRNFSVDAGGKGRRRRTDGDGDGDRGPSHRCRIGGGRAACDGYDDKFAKPRDLPPSMEDGRGKIGGGRSTGRRHARRTGRRGTASASASASAAREYAFVRGGVHRPQILCLCSRGGASARQRIM